MPGRDTNATGTAGWLTRRRWGGAPGRGAAVPPVLEPLEPRLLLSTAAGAGAGEQPGLFVDSGVVLPGVEQGDLAWGDYDSDGDLDLAVMGLSASGFITRIYRNDGGEQFTDVGADLRQIYAGSLAWGDYDSDGDLDLAVVGNEEPTPHGTISKIYHNDAGIFIDIDADLKALGSSSLAWGDQDNDATLDIAIAGAEATWTERTKIFSNEGADHFSDIGANIPGASGVLAWADYDNDGDLDLAVAGSLAGPVSRIYRNQGDETFVDAAANLADVTRPALAWADYDNDGDLDLALAGWDGSTQVSKIYRNDAGAFADAGAALVGLESGALAWGDYDNDGDPDLAAAGYSPAGHVCKIYRNDAGTFIDAAVPLPALRNPALGWGDYDGDGDLDLVLAGHYYDGAHHYVTKIYQNAADVSNTASTAPAGLTAEVTDDTVTLSWAAADDAQTPPAGLSYNLRLGTGPGLADVVSGMADPAGGQRRLPAIGSAQKRLTWALSLPNGDYYASVQAIDAAFAGSAWAGEVQFTVRVPVVVHVDNDPSDGTWSGCYTDLQDALAFVVAGDEIWVAASTYRPTAGADRGVSFQMVQGVGIYGGFRGGETKRNRRDWLANQTILSGDIGVAGDQADNSYHVVLGADGAVLNGFTISAGNANGGGADDNGGGMLNVASWPIVTNCVFSDNLAAGGGAGMHNLNCDVTVTGCTFIANRSDGSGGGMDNSGSAGNISRTAFHDNWAQTGGGMSNRNGSYPTINSCTFTSNSAAMGGGVWNHTAAPTVASCTFVANSANEGAGIYEDVWSAHSIANSLFWGNAAGFGRNVHFAWIADAPTLRHCNAQGSGGSGAGWDASQGIDGGGNIDSAPLLVDQADPAGRDGAFGTFDDGLRLAGGGVCIDAGDGDAAAPRDMLDWGPVDDPATPNDRAAGTPPFTDIGAYEYQAVEIRGLIWHDTDGSAAPDPGEPPLAGWTVYLDSDGDGALDAAEMRQSADAAGGYGFTSLAPGTYTVTQVVPPGWMQTLPAFGAPLPHVIQLAAAQTAENVDFGNVVRGDADGNGQVDVLDLTALANNFGRSWTGLSGGDFNGDGLVDVLDLAVLANNFGYGTGGGAASGGLAPAGQVEPAGLAAGRAGKPHHVRRRRRGLLRALLPGLSGGRCRVGPRANGRPLA